MGYINKIDLKIDYIAKTAITYKAWKKSGIIRQESNS